MERAAAVFWKPRKWICFKAGKQPLHVSPEGLENQSHSKVSFILSPLSQIHVEKLPLRNLKRKPKKPKKQKKTQQHFKEGMKGKTSGLGTVQIQSRLWASWVLPRSALPWLGSYPITKSCVTTHSCQLQNYPKTWVLSRNLTNWPGSPAYFPHSHKAQTQFQFLPSLPSSPCCALFLHFCLFVCFI